MENVLIASLGDSPIVITAMYDLLKKEEEQVIDKIVVLYPEKEALISTAFDLIREAFRDRCEVIPEYLPFEDVANEADSFYFLRTLYRVLNDAQKSENRVYLSLAGGRKNMSALMAILVPLFPCVEGLYHVIDLDEGTRRYHFKSVEDIFDLPDDERLSYFLLTDDQLKRLKLVEIPYGKQQQVSEAFRSRIYTLQDEEDLDDLYAFVQNVSEEPEPERILEVLLTKHAAEQFKDMWKYDRTHAREFKFCLERLRFATIARRDSKDIYTRKLRKEERDAYTQNFSALTFHYFKIKRKHGTSVERPVFFTLPKDIKSAPDEEVERAIVSELEYKRGDSYRSLEEITNAHDFFPLGPYFQADKLIADVAAKKAQRDDTAGVTQTRECALVVPLGTTPMIATQLYTLLTHQGSTIGKVVLVYPANSQQIKMAASLVQKAFEEEGKGVNCQPVTVPGYADIDSKAACIAYEKALEEAIDSVRGDYQVELALSGGRKGMAALAMFVAQRKGIRHVYHTLIPDRQLSDKVERETEIDALRPTLVSSQVRNNRLFLRTYEGSGPSTKFVLFRVPVLPAKG